MTTPLEAFRAAEPGTVVTYNGGRGLTNTKTLKARKDDDTGWWLVEGGGLDDFAFEQGPWEIKP